MLDGCGADITKALGMIIATYERGGKLLLCGNGGSAADCEHISGELLKGFMSKRPLAEGVKVNMRERCPKIETELLEKLQSGLAAIPLTSLSSVNSAFANDVDPALVYAQGVIALGKAGDLLIALSTSGNSENVVNAVKVAKAIGMCVVGLSGEGGGELKSLSDVCICAPERETYKVQELHLPIYHYLCEAVERHFFG